MPETARPTSSPACSTAPRFGPEHLVLMPKIGLGGAPIPDAVAERADRLGITLTRAYGCTEHPSVTGSLHTDAHAKRIHTDGRPLEHIEVRTVDGEGATSPLGYPGEIVTRGPDRFAGYTDPALTAAAIDAQGWFSTGDIGVLDARRVPDGDRPGEGHHHPRRGEHQCGGGRAADRRHRTGWPKWQSWALPTSAWASTATRSCACRRAPRHRRSTTSAGASSRQGSPGRSGPRSCGWSASLPRTPSGKVQKFVLRRRLREGT